MRFSLVIGCVTACFLSGSLATPLCSTTDCANYPTNPLTFQQLREAVMGGQKESRVYYEVFSMDPSALKMFGLPVLRKTSVRWIFEGDDHINFPGNYTNDYAGWIPFNPNFPDNTGKCENGNIKFEALIRKGMRMSFRFLSVYPTEELHVGTSFSSHPEKYLINWYCPETQLVYGGKFGIKWCKSGARMSIYSPTATTELPLENIIEDLCKSKSPKLSDPRWTMTYDAPEICVTSGNGGRKKRSTGIRHYL